MLKIVYVLHFIPAHQYSGRGTLCCHDVIYFMTNKGMLPTQKELITTFVPGKNTFISDIESSTAWERNSACSAKVFCIVILQCVCEMTGSSYAFVLFIDSSILELSIQ